MSAFARSRWLFGPKVDLGVFLGSALLSFAALGVGALVGVGNETPDWAWIPAVLLVDVAHVWATGFRVYFDGRELSRRPLLYAAVPVAGYLASAIVYRALGPAAFWRALAYLAIFHFARQQYGWLALYRARCGEKDPVGRLIDVAAIYAATLYPLVFWHTHLPRRFDWFVPHDIVSLPALFDGVAKPVYVAVLAAYLARSALAWRRGQGNLGKDVVVSTTAACWYVGIVALDSDYAFSVMNVFIHGIPYFALVYVTRARTAKATQEPSKRSLAANLFAFLGVLWIVAYAEELVWDRAVWQERSWLFGAPWDVGEDARSFLVPALALPQLTHYILDGFIWRRRSNPDVASALTEAAAPAAA